MRSLKRKNGPEEASTKPATTEESDQRRSKRAKPSGCQVAAAPTKPPFQDEEALFPRGGGSLLTALEQRQIRIQARQDALYEQANGAGTHKHAKAQRTKAEPCSKPQAALNKRGGEALVTVERLKIKTMKPSTLVLGQICDIKPLGLDLALPNNLVGHVPITAISDILTARLQAAADQQEKGGSEDGGQDGYVGVDLGSLFETGQYVRACVVSTKDEVAAARGHHRHLVRLSMQPVHANAGLTEQDVVANVTVMASVRSVEDAGFAMEIGMAESCMKAFLPRNQLDPSVCQDRVQPGSVMLCIVTSKSGGRVAQLSTRKDKLGNVHSQPSEATTIKAFLPGTAADVAVRGVSDRGIVGTIFGSLDATADIVHSGAGSDGVILGDAYQVGSRVLARVIHTCGDESKPKVAVSFLPHICLLVPKTALSNGQERPPLSVLRPSAFVEHCTVFRIEPCRGLFVHVGVATVCGFVPINRISDGKLARLSESSGPYRCGSVHRGRVIGYNALDGLYAVSLQKKTLDQPFLRVEDIAVGETVSATVQELLVNDKGFRGLLVKLADGIAGLVPELHLADVRLQHPEKKFQPGLKLTARVLSTDPSRHRVCLTLKKTLVRSEAPAVASFDHVHMGMQLPATVTKMGRAGAMVHFYGSLCGFLPRSEMSEAYMAGPDDHFRPGQVVTVRVKECDGATKRLIVSCKDASTFGMDKQLALQRLHLADLVSATVVHKTDDKVFLELLGSSLPAVLPAGHVGDQSASKTRSALKRICIGQTLADLVVINKSDQDRAVTVSHKPSLVEASKRGTLLTSLDEAAVGQEVQGFVQNLIPTGVFVEFAGRIRALLPKALMPQAWWQRGPDFGLRRFQPVLVKIRSVDRLNKRLRVAIPSVDQDLQDAVRPSKPLAQTLDHPIDPSLVTTDDLVCGRITKARIVAVKATQLNVRLANKVQGRVDVCAIYDGWEEIAKPKFPLQSFKPPRQVVAVRILGTHHVRGHRFLPISHRGLTEKVLELSMKPSLLEQADMPAPLSLHELELGSTHLAFVVKHETTCVWARLNHAVKGRIRLTDLTDDWTLAANAAVHFPLGCALRVRVVAVDLARNWLDLSARSASARPDITLDRLEPDMVLAGKITRVRDDHIMVQLGQNLAGAVYLADMADDYDQANPAHYAKFEIVRVSVVELDKSKKRIRLSMRPSRIMSAGLPVKDREMTRHAKLEVGDLVRGFVKNMTDTTLFVALGGDASAMVKSNKLSDAPLQDWHSHLQLHQLVEGCVLSVQHGRVRMSLRESDRNRALLKLLTLETLAEGQVVTGRVRGVEQFGAFIAIDGSAHLSGLCHRSEMAEGKVDDARTLYAVDDPVQARILKVDMVKRQISLGLKPSYFAPDLEHGPVRPADKADGDAEDGAPPDEEDADSHDGDMDLDDHSDVHVSSSNDATGLDAGPFDWSGRALDADGDMDLDGAHHARPRQQSGARRRPKIDVDKTGELDAHGPQTPADYERLLLGQPDASDLWIRYMAFHMHDGGLAKARGIAERALMTINIRQQTDKLQVWVAWLNLENQFGTDETLDKVFQRACAYSDAQHVHECLASICIASGKLDKAESTFEAMVNKFGSSAPKVWTNYADFFHVTARAPHRARALLKRATQVLGRDPHLYLPLVVKFAAMEYHAPHGDKEQGRTLLESVLATYPNRSDLWSVFLDLEAAAYRKEKQADGPEADAVAVRNLFERRTRARGLKAKWALKWFKRWADWEAENGDSKSAEHVLTRAAEWTQAAEERKREAKANGHHD